ncbi:hypothetical protein [Mitsuaria sp. 7]|uniref:hypothetical protein n=1 Tax=Mitsuaria sp. 7 TaxID=1658665 RepID=UPI0007DDD0B3|nr:hypothetical protein [Mitsuaria sp. 7]ANH67592.1 hypothetical protein ABE85_08490 [Mitsuaria sp. 7]
MAAFDHAQVLARLDAQAAAGAALSSRQRTTEELIQLQSATEAEAAGMMARLKSSGDDDFHDALLTLRQHLTRTLAHHRPALEAHAAAAQAAFHAAQTATLAHRELAGRLHEPGSPVPTGPGRAERERMALEADEAARNAASHRDQLQVDADAAVDAVRRSIQALTVELQPPPLAPRVPDPAIKPGFLDRLRRPFDALRLRAAVPRIEGAIGPISLSGSTSKPEFPSKQRAQVFQPTTTADDRGLAAADRQADAAARGAVVGLTDRSNLATTKDTKDKVVAGNAGLAVDARTAFSSAVAFDAEIERMFPAASTTSRLAITRLATTLLDHPNPDPVLRPDGHRLRYEQALLIATGLRSVTADPTQALQVYQRLRLETPPALDDFTVRSADSPSPSMADLGSGSRDVARMTHQARRALAATAGGFQALLDLQGLALPPTGDPHRSRGEEAFEFYKLGLRAEDALLATDLAVGGSQSMADIRAALDAHPQRGKLLDAARLGTGNARREPDGQREEEDPATLAAQAFMYATDNLRRAPGQAEVHHDLKPAYVALRNGFTKSGQGSDFHLMAKRLRKFVTYIDLACKTPDGGLPTKMHKARLPIRVLRRFAGKDKSPLETMLKAGPIETTATIRTPQGDLDTRQDAKRLQKSFNAASPPERRDMLRQVMVAATGGRPGTYSDGRRHGVGVTAGYGLVDVGGLGGLNAGSITPVVEVSAEHSRAAVFRAGIAETGLLYLGSERKISGSVGAGVRAGVQAGPIVNVSAQAMARIGGSHLASRGLMIRTRKAGREHETLPADQAAALKATDWKRMNELVINSIFEIAGQDKADRPAHGGAMWAQMVEKLGDFRDISFGWNEGKAVTADVSVTLDATASAKLPLGFAASASAGIGLKRTLFDRKRTRDAAGTARSVQAEQGSRSAARAGMSAGISHPALPTSSGRSVALFGRHRVGVETELVIQAQSSLVRLVTEDGRLRPELSTRDREFGVRDDFIRAMNAQRERWVDAMGDRGPDGKSRGGERKYDDFMRQLVNLPAAGSRIYRSHQALTPEAAEEINACMDRLAVLQRPPPSGTPQDPRALDQVQDLQREIAALVEDPAHWQPSGLDVVQSIQAASAWSGGVDTSVTVQPGSDQRNGAERLLGGGRLAVGGRIRTAVGGKILLALDAARRPGPSPDSARPHEARLSAMPDFSDSTMHDTMALAH